MNSASDVLKTPYSCRRIPRNKLFCLVNGFNFLEKQMGQMDWRAESVTLESGMLYAWLNVFCYNKAVFTLNRKHV